MASTGTQVRTSIIDVSVVQMLTYYTGSNTPLHQAARGNHVDIINLICNGPDKESIEYAAQKGIDLSETWQFDLESNDPRMTLEDDEGKESEEMSLSPLAMAIMFSNLDAALALMSHGAQLNLVGEPFGYGRKRILQCLFKRSKAAKNIFEKKLDEFAAGRESGTELAVSFRKFMRGEEEEEDDDDEDYPWDGEDWDQHKVG